MPANRSRTTQWRRCLEQVHRRNGALEIAVARPGDRTSGGPHLVWRVRILALETGAILVEPPVALGQVIDLHEGVALTAVMTVGQNRWMFSTACLGPGPAARAGRARSSGAVRLRMPEQVRRCQRRSPRVQTGQLDLPRVEFWPLLEPRSVVVAERAYELAHQNGAAGGPDEDLMPEVGPKFHGSLLNVGGGGVGLLVSPEHAQALAHHKLFWLRIALPPQLATPICASAKLVHTHLQSDQHVYAGLAFDFSFNHGHQRVVVGQIRRFVACQQREQIADTVSGNPRAAV